MEYSIYKLDFQTGVHFGNGMLNDSACTFLADQIFSALFIEALKLGQHKEFYDMVKGGKVLFSDTFPYIGKQYMVPMPMVYIEPVERGKSDQKKKMKKLKYLLIEDMESYLNGTLELTSDIYKNGFGKFVQQTMASVSGEEETKPYRVGTFYFKKNCGLYVIVAYQTSEECIMVEELFEALSYTGIGGKKSIGLGKFTFRKAKIPEELLRRLNDNSGRQMLLSVALPRDEELDEVLEKASYQLDKRSGFVASDTYAEEWRRKRDLYVLMAGSCFEQRFEGDIYDVSDGGNHPVYRYAKALLMEV